MDEKYRFTFFYLRKHLIDCQVNCEQCYLHRKHSDTLLQYWAFPWGRGEKWVINKSVHIKVNTMHTHSKDTSTGASSTKKTYWTNKATWWLCSKFPPCWTAWIISDPLRCSLRLDVQQNRNVYATKALWNQSLDSTNDVLDYPVKSQTEGALKFFRNQIYRKKKDAALIDVLNRSC